VVSASVPDALARRLQQLAIEADRSLSGEVRRALAEHVRQQEEIERLQSVYQEGEQ
jgi:predicted transcriptional regulator